MHRSVSGLAIAIATVLTFALTLQTVQAGTPAMGWSEVAQRVIPATVNITVEKIARDGDGGGIGHRESFSGSGFIVDPSGYIVTNKHVISGAFRINVMLHDGTELSGTLVAAAAMVDIAVLKVDAGRALPSLKLADGDSVRIGDPVLAVGNPLGLGTSLSSGIISAVNRDLRNTPFDDYIQTDAAINHGNSGGPLIDTNGDVIGVDTILLTNVKDEGSNGLGFAISSTVVNYVVRHLRNPDSTPVGWIGAHVQDATRDLAAALALKKPGGFIVTGIDADSSASQAGLQSGDIILRFGQRQPSDARALLRDIAMMPIGRTVDVLIWRNGHEQTIPVEIRAWPHLMEPRGAMLASADTQVPLAPPDLGMLLAPITEMARKHYAIGGTKGVLVAAVDQQSEVYGLGVAPGEIIEKVQDTAVSTPTDVLRLVHEAAGSDASVAVLVRWKDGPRWIVLHTGHGTVAEAMDESPIHAPPKGSPTGSPATQAEGATRPR